MNTRSKSKRSAGVSDSESESETKRDGSNSSNDSDSCGDSSSGSDSDSSSGSNSDSSSGSNSDSDSSSGSDSSNGSADDIDDDDDTHGGDRTQSDSQGETQSDGQGETQGDDFTRSEESHYSHEFAVLALEVDAILKAALGPDAAETALFLIKLLNFDRHSMGEPDVFDQFRFFHAEKLRPSFLLQKNRDKFPKVKYLSQVFQNLSTRLKCMEKGTAGCFCISAYKKMVAFLEENPEMPTDAEEIGSLRAEYNGMTASYFKASHTDINGFPGFNELWDMYTVTSFHGVSLLMLFNLKKKQYLPVVPVEAFPLTSWLIIFAESLEPIPLLDVQTLLQANFATKKNWVGFLLSNKYRAGRLKKYTIKAVSIQDLEATRFKDSDKNDSDKKRKILSSEPLLPHVQTGECAFLAYHIFAYQKQDLVSSEPTTTIPRPFEDLLSRSGVEEASSLGMGSPGQNG